MLQGVFLKVLHKMDGPTAGYEIVMVQIEIAAGTLVPPHTHPGVEFNLRTRRFRRTANPRRTAPPIEAWRRVSGAH